MMDPMPQRAARRAHAECIWLAWGLTLALGGCGGRLSNAPSTCAPTTEPVAFGVASFAGRGGAGNPFLGVYKAGRFIDQADERWGETQAKATAKRLFPLDRVLPALTQDGNHTEVRIEREGSWTWDIGGSFFEQMRMRDFISGWGLVLFWTSSGLPP